MSKRINRPYSGRVRQLRKSKRGLSQATLSELCGRHPQWIKQLEMGVIRLDVDGLVVLADYFEVSADWIIGRTNKK